jgi:hypothetical protein
VIQPHLRHDPGPTQFLELNERAAGILGDRFVGAYLQGSFAVGDADIHGDCDLPIPVHGPITSDQEAGLRALHPRWSNLIQHALDDGRLGWDPHAPPRMGSVDQTLAFVADVQRRLGVEPRSR